MTSDKKTISIPQKGWIGGNRDYYRHILVTFKTTVEFVIVLVRLIFRKLGADGFTGPRRESEIRYECNLKIVLKGLGCK